MKNGIIAIVLLIIGFIGGYAAKGLQVGMEQNDVTLQEALQEVKGMKKEEKQEVVEETKQATPIKEEVLSTHPVEATIQKDFQVFKQAAEGYLNSLVGKTLDPNAFNVFLDADYKLFYDRNGILLSNKQDQWGNFYQVFINPNKQKIVVQTNGEGKGGYVLASYQQSGNIESCTRGFKEGAWDLTRIFLKTGETCGGDLQ